MPTKPLFTIKDIPDLSGKFALVTGATGGLGFETALGLAAAGATVFVGGRNADKGKVALDKIKEAVPNAAVSFALIDHGSLASVTAFAVDYNGKGQPLDVLVNNAGIMAPPNRLTTSDNFEIQLGTNHLSHFALTAQLLPSLRRSTYPSRVVNVASIAARRGVIEIDDLNSTKNYNPMSAYRQSKLANLLFTFELQRKSDQGSWGISSIAAHPGVSRTELVSNGFGNSSFRGRIFNLFGPLIAQSAERGALPILYAAGSPDAEKSGYYGPNGFYELKGDVTEAWVPDLAKDVEMAKRFWEESEKLTKVTFPK